MILAPSVYRVVAELLDITVVMPTFNRSRLVTRALNSIAAQTRRPARVIVVDDCSTDGTPDVVRQWAVANDFTTTVDVLPENSGPAAARNRGIRLSETNYIAFLDSDDEYLPQALESLLKPLEKMQQRVLSFGDATIVSSSGQEPNGLFRPHFKSQLNYKKVDGLVPEVFELCDPTTDLLKASIIPTSASCFRRQAAINAGLMPESFRSGEDWLFWLRLGQQGVVVFQLDDLALHHRHETNLTGGEAGAFIAGEKMRGLLALAEGKIGVNLSDAHQQTLKKLKQRQLSVWLYQASRLGLSRYLESIQSEWLRPLGSPIIQLIRNPRSFARALISSFQ